MTDRGRIFGAGYDHNRRILERIELKLEALTHKIGIVIMKIDELLTAVDDATTQAAANVEVLIAALKASGGTLTAEQEAKATATIAHLKAIGVDASAPVPTPDPAFVA